MEDGRRTGPNKIAILVVPCNSVVVGIQVPSTPYGVHLRHLGGQGAGETAQTVKPYAIYGHAGKNPREIGPADGAGGHDSVGESMRKSRERGDETKGGNVEPEYLCRVRRAEAVHPV